MSSEGFKETDIGLIPEDWGFLSLRNICNIQMGQSPPSKYYNIESKGLPFFQGRKDFGNKYPKVAIWCSKPNRIAEEGDVLLSVRAPVGDINVSKEKCCIGRGLSSVAMKNNNNEFIYYLFQYNKKRLKDIFESEGTVFGCITKKGLHDFKVAVPPEQEQSKIAKILSQFDQKIEINHQMNQTLEQICQSIFLHWFVHFEFPDDEGRPYKSSGGEMVNSELGEIPKGWEVGKFGKIVDNFDKKRIPLSKKQRESCKGQYPYYGATSIMDHVDDFLFDGTHVLMAEDGSVIDDDEKPVLQYVWGKFWVNNHAHVLKGKNGISDEFIYLLLKNTNIKHLVTGAVQLKINQKNMNSLQVVIPDLDIISKFSEIIKPIFAKYRASSDENKILINIRDSLLPKLMSGKIRVNIPEEATVK